MPHIKIFNVKDSTLDRTVSYENGESPLLEILKKYDPSVEKSRCRVAIGDVLFNDWTIPIEVCIVYGDSISISYHTKSSFQEFTIFIDQRHVVPKIPIIIDETTTIRELKIKLQNKKEYLPEDQIFTYREKYLADHIVLYNIGIGQGSKICLRINQRGGGGFSFANLAENGVKTEWSQKAPEWRGVDCGLCFEGKCTNLKCVAYKRMVVMNMGTRIIYKMGFPGQKPTCCPMCNKYVKPETCGFSNCEFRSIGIMEGGANGPVRHKSEWIEVGDEYYRFDESKKANWIR